MEIAVTRISNEGLGTEQNRNVVVRPVLILL